MSTSPVSPEDIRAAAEVHHELGPEYSDAVVAAFLDRVDKEVAARVAARLAESSRGRIAKRVSRRTLAAGVAIGACAGALITGISVAHLDHSGPAAPASAVPFVHRPANGKLRVITFPDGNRRVITLPDGRQISLPGPQQPPAQGP
jgi:hypothetical protein